MQRLSSFIDAAALLFFPTTPRGRGKKRRRVVAASVAQYTLAGKQQAAKRAARWLRREAEGRASGKPPGHIAAKLDILRAV